ncbi:MAG: ATP-binding protein [Pseudomonadales bacterium]
MSSAAQVPTSHEVDSFELVNEEKSQAIARIVLSFLFVIAIAIVAWSDGLNLLDAYSHATVVVICYALFGVGWWFLLVLRPNGPPMRRVVVIFGDLGIVSWGLIQLAESGTMFYPLYLWVIVGNGMRFGVTYLVIALFAAQIGFSTVYFFSDYWRANLELGIALQIAMLVLPLFYLSLVRRLHQLNDKLALEAQRSHAAAESKSQFLANMSHELRTPMNGVLGISALLRDTELDRQQREMLELIYRSADSLLGIINDILDYSKVESGKLGLEATGFDLKDCVDDVVMLLTHKADEKGLLLEHDYPADVPSCFIGDRTRIRQILVNLIGNSIKFTEQGEVRVTSSVTLPEADHATLSIKVADSGIGIAPQNLDRVFDQFEQADESTTRLFGGTGLGLAISRKLARTMGGDLTVASELGQGSCFTLHLELEPIAAERVVQEAFNVVERNYKIRALVVEDNRVNQMVAQGLLGKVGIQVDLAENGKIGVDKFLSGSYDLVFMDLQMPVMGGKEATRIIRSQTSQHPVPIVALSANVSGERCVDNAAQFDAFLEKPFKLQDLVPLVDRLLPRVS